MTAACCWTSQTAGIAHGKVVLARAKSTPLPRGMMLDKNGRPSSDAGILDDGAVLLAMGLHKGSGLALMMEIIPTLLAGHRPISVAGIPLWQSNPADCTRA